MYVWLQVQCQLFCTSRAYCDFIVWTCKDVHIERIYPDEQFWLECVEKAQLFFSNAILPELIGKWFSRPPPVSTSVLSSVLNVPTTSDKEEQYCYCKGPESGDMIGCDNPSCPYRWFHFDCLKLTVPPRSKKWFCPDCRKLPHVKKTKLK